jgi:hypothetical protein
LEASPKEMRKKREKEIKMKYKLLKNCSYPIPPPGVRGLLGGFL